MANDIQSILFPPGRLIMGSCYKGSDKDQKGQPRLVKTGPNKGQPTVQFFLGVAIPKGSEQHWSQTAWGQIIWATGHAAFPAFAQNPAFAWKIDDGDSTIPNKSNKRPCDSEGAKGHWIVKFSSSFAPKVYVQPSPGVFQEVPTPDAVKPGFWIQVFGSVAGNKSQESPGVYVNHDKVLFVREDAVISQGVDAATAFGGAAVSAALPTVAAVPFAAATPAPGAFVPPATPAAPAAAVPPQPAGVAVAPHPGFLAGPGAPGVPGAPAAPVPMAPPVPPAPVAPPVPAEPAMTAAGASSGFTYAQYRANGWSDDQLRAAGLIV
jgi:hypothetical protein